MRPTISILLAATACGVATASIGLAQTRPTLASQGRQIVEKYCSRCHAIGRAGESSHAKAPPFRDVVKKYPPQSLAEALAEGIVSGHPEMPEIAFPPGEVDAIVTYLDTLIEPPRQ